MQDGPLIHSLANCSAQIQCAVSRQALGTELWTTLALQTSQSLGETGFAGAFVKYFGTKSFFWGGQGFSVYH